MDANESKKRDDAASNAQVDLFSLVSEEEKQKLLYEWNNTSRPYPRDKTIHQLFEEQAELNPNKIAVNYHDQSITYKALNEKANQLAHFIQSKQKTKFVAICLDKCIEAIIAMLAILKAGSAYLPIDPDYPLERIEYMLKDSEAKLVLTSANKIKYLNQIDLTAVNVVDIIDPGIYSGPSSSFSSSKQDAKALAYLIYTSGTTGQPKGVMLTHRGAVRFAKNNNCMNINAHHVVAQCASLSFDMAGFEIWMALLNGAELVLIDKAHLLDPLRFHKAILSNAITAVVSVPTLFNQLFYSKPEIYDTLDYFMLGGEAVSAQVLEKLAAREKRPAHILNGYGPTENSSITTCYEITKKDNFSQSIPIGAPIANTTCYILDESMRLMPIGEAGELYISGDGVSLGYLNLENLTSERFVCNPFVDHSENKLYKTGDMARWLPNGKIDFLGRKDAQVKVSGFRVELEEIEVALNKVKLVQEASVIFFEDQESFSGDIVAFVVREDEALTDELISIQLRKFLPEHMLPSRLLFLKTLPMTINGKVDREQLKKGYIENHKKSLLEDPSCFLNIHSLIQFIFNKILGCPCSQEVSNFFLLGGDSLKALRAVSLAYQYGLKLDVQTIFSYPTLVSLTNYLCKQQGNIGKFSLKKSLLEEGRGSKHERLKLSPMQLGMLYHINEEGASGYLAQFYFDIYDQINADRLKASWQMLIDRHSILRSSFLRDENDSYYREINDSAIVNFSYQDFSKLPLSQHIKILNRFLAEDRKKGASPDDRMLPRITLIKFSKNKYTLVFIHNHLVIDGWSLDILFKELFVIYKSKMLSKEPLLPREGDYNDFVTWALRDPDQASLSFWERELKDYSSKNLAENLGCKTSNIDYQCKRSLVKLSLHETSQINKFIQNSNITLFSFVSSIWLLVLRIYNNSSDNAFGMVVSLLDKELANLDSLVGPVINTVPFRFDIKDKDSFLTFARSVQEKVLKLVEHSKTPLYEIKRVSKQVKNDIFDTLLTIENYSSYSKEFLKTGRLNIYDTNNYPLFVRIFNEEKIEIEFVYNKSIFSKSVVNAIMKEFLYLMKECINKKDKPLVDLEYVPRTLKAFLSYGNKKVVDLIPSPFKSVIRLFEEQAIKHESKIALKDAEIELTYFELNQKVNQLAKHLLSLGVNKGEKVAVFAEKRAYTIIAILAIIKSGCAYVAIDPRLPEIRIEYIFKDASIRFFLSKTPLKLNKNIKLVVLDAFYSEPHTKVYNDAFTPILPQDLIYVLYTSGTTGKPKGVLIEHRSVAYFIDAMLKKFNLPSYHLWAQFHSLSFDVSVWELFGSLLSGATLVVANDNTLLSPEYFFEFLNESRITVLCQTPSYFKQLVSVDDKLLKQLLLKRVFLAGERLDYQSIRLWNEKCPDADTRFIDTYGPTETTVYSTAKKMKPGFINSSQRASIGRPLSDMFGLVVCENKLMPTYAAGELYHGGPQLSLGYLNLPKTTNKQFLNHSYYGRLYKTGDLVRSLPGGEIEFIGRIDDQVKLRGLRVELTEIEVVIAEQKDVSQSVVLMRNQGDAAYLVAYVLVPKEVVDAFDVGELRKRLFLILPPYMVPAVYVVLDELPLTSSGKIDKKILISLATNHHPVNPELSTLVLSKEEKGIILIFSSLLNVKPSELHQESDFFESGGNSLLVMSAVSKIKQSFNTSLAIKDFVESPTPRGIANKIQIFKSKEQGARSSVMLLKEGNDTSPLFLFHPIGGSVLPYMNLARTLQTDKKIYGIQDPGLEESQLLFFSIEEMSKEYLRWIKEIQPKGPYYLVGSSFGATVAYEISRLLINEGEKVALLGMIDGWALYPDDVTSKQFLSKYLSDYHKRLKGMADEVGYSLPTLWVDLHVQRNEILFKYQYRKIEIDIVLFKAKELLPVLRDFNDPYNFWNKYASREPKVYLIPGDHDTMLDKDNVVDLAKELDKYL